MVQTAFRSRKVESDTVARWQDVSLDSRMAKTVSAVGQAVVEGVLARFLSEGASAATQRFHPLDKQASSSVRIE
ncbi:hypothetical protein [Curtobacterium sp. MR_MD2014]|uniref:hypothetical protein n=1 Tax=Curtobacterium sp. MR_MD2014 TaxID=1561023 RepID=UPI00052AABF6|nr:hypothetical protein [Curtobacterium sp. MR_MD2014]AIV39855.1 hypothetical protein NI26_05900 [Curtobacterium sp. MR_MD2014]